MSHTQRLTRRSVRRGFVLSAVGALVGALLPASMAFAQEAPPTVDPEQACANAPEDSPFTDISGHTFEDEITCLAWYAITEGKTETTYVPNEQVSRAQMASFFVRLIEGANALDADGDPELADLPPYDGTNQFDDVGDDSEHVERINRLAQAGIVEGRTADMYAPGNNISRDQMASFINRTQDFLVDGDVDGEDGFQTDNDYFTDDDGNVHEDNINAIASVGITRGQDAADQFNPKNPVSRGQMAAFIMRHVEVNVVDGVINAKPADVESNQTFEVVPDTEATVTDDDAAPGETDDQRQYSVANPVADTEHDIALFNADRVDVAAGGNVTFLDAAGDPEDGGTAGQGTVASRIVVVNGSPGDMDQQDEATPVNGNLTFTVDGDGFESVIPVVFFDEDGDGSLDLNSDGTPTADEPFGAGGQLNVLPTEAAFGPPAADANIEGIDKGADWIVADDTGTVELYNYDSNDTFFADSDGTGDCVAADQVTLSGFEEVLTVGDDLGAASTSYQPNAELSSTFCLLNTNPLAPELVDPADADASVDQTDTSAEINVDESTIDSGAIVNVYLGADGEAFAAADLVESTDTDGDAGEDEFQVTISNLTESTAYEVYLTQTVDGEQSGPNQTAAGAATGFATTATPDSGIEIESVSPGDVNDGAGTATTVIVVFSKDVTCVTTNQGDALTVSPAGQPGIQNDSTACAPDATATDTLTYTLTNALNDAANDVTYNVTIDAGGVDSADGPSPELSGQFAY